MNLKPNVYGAFHTGQLRSACVDCLCGKKMVIFVTGLCPKHCFYCPVSEEKMYHDVQFANERPLRKGHEIEDLIAEARACNATGASLTGGDPLVQVNRCCEYISALKKEFGPKFHIHLYTWGLSTLATAENLKKLEDAGLDEIRFHLFKDPDFSRILPALKTKMQVTVEVPCIPTPENEAELKELIAFMKQNGLKYLNLNELEFSDANFERLTKRGFTQANEIEYRAKGSLQLGQKIASLGRPEINVHYCSSANKSYLQVGSRMKRRATTTRKPFETVNADGMIEKFVVEGNNLTKETANQITKEFGSMAVYNETKNRIETNEKIAQKLSREFGFDQSRVAEMPVFEPWDVEKIPIRSKKK